MTDQTSDEPTLTLWQARIVLEARAWIGTPYLHQASLRGAGCDCLGLVRGVWRALYGDEPEPVPHYTADWGEADGEEVLLAAALRHFVPVERSSVQAGDLLVFRWQADSPAKHIGLATTAQTMIHAHAGACVSEVPFGVWSRKIAARFCFPEPVSS
jgi:NlpC/P60 family putative phage cell wall peptidase